MIPKTIHYCWFGRKKYPRTMKKCLVSWKRFCPDYELKCWNEDNTDISKCKYAQEAFAAKKWAFVADYVRAFVLYTYGGIYMDSDMLVIKNFDFALQNKAFCSLSNPGLVSMGLLGFEKNNPLIKEHLDSYKLRSFIKRDGTIDFTTNVTVFSNSLKRRGLGTEDKNYLIDTIHIYPTDYFYPTDFEGVRNNFTVNTCALHLHSASWLSLRERIFIKFRREYRLFYTKIFNGESK